MTPAPAPSPNAGCRMLDAGDPDLRPSPSARLRVADHLLCTVCGCVAAALLLLLLLLLLHHLLLLLLNCEI